MKVISFCSTKGGTGKSSLSILTALTLSAHGKKVLVIDLDPQHSSTFFFLPDSGAASIFKVLMGESVLKNIMKTDFNVDVIPSDLRLLDCRTIETNRLKKILKELSEYDYIVIDTAPTYDNLTQNAYLASDLIIIPSTVDAFSWKTCHFLLEKLKHMDVAADVGIVLNLWTPPKETTKSTAWSVREMNIFKEDELISGYLMKNNIPRSIQLRRIIAEKGYKLSGKSLLPILSFVEEMTGKKIDIEFIGEVA